MKKLQLVILSVLASLVLGACSNSSSNNSNSTGFAIFFHNITDAAQLDLNGDDRDYGSINFEQFGNGISLDAKTWDLDVVDPDPSDSSGDKTILETNFSVPKNERRIFALTGTLASPTLYALDLSEDTEADGADGEDKDNIYINVSHINPNKNVSLRVFFLSLTEAGAFDGSFGSLPSVAEMTLSLGQTHEDLVLGDDDQRIVIVDNTDAIVFDSGAKSLKDALHQTLLITNYVDVQQNAQVSVHYYGLGGVDGLFNEVWRDTTAGAAKGYVRIFNLLKDDAPSPLSLDVTVKNASNATVANSAGLAYGASSGYYELDPGGYKVELDATGSAAYNVLVESGVAKTMYFYSHVEGGSIEDADSPKVVVDDKRTINGGSKLTFIHLWYEEEVEDLVKVNLHLLDSPGIPDSESRKLSGAAFKSVSNLTINDDANYTAVATSTNDVISYDDVAITLNEGDNKQLVLGEGASGGAQLLDTTQDLPAAPVP